MNSTVGSADILLSLNLVPLDKDAHTDTLNCERTANSHCLNVGNRAIADGSVAEDAAGSADILPFPPCDVQLSSAQTMLCDISVPPSHGAFYDITNTDLGSLFSWEVQTTATDMAGEVTTTYQHRATYNRPALLDVGDVPDSSRRSARKKAYGRWGPIRAALATLGESGINSEESTDSITVGTEGHSARGRHLRQPSRASYSNVVGSGTLACPHCSASFDSYAVYRRHCMFKHSDGCHVPCLFCVRSFRRPAGRDEHMRRAHSGLVDDRASTVSDSLVTVRPSQAGASGLLCTVCKRSYATIDALAAHLASPIHLRRRDKVDSHAVATAQLLTAHHADVLRRCRYQCRLCDFQSSTAGGLIDHLKSQRHAEVTERLVGPTWCQRCGFYSYDVTDVVAHVIKASEHRNHVGMAGDSPSDGCHSLPSAKPGLCIIGEKRFAVPCRHCGHRCHSATHLARHLKAVHAPAALPRHRSESPSAAAADSATVCPDCGWKARSRYNLVVHVRRRHTGERPFACCRCRVAFTDKYSLTVHYRTRKHKEAVLSDGSRLTICIPAKRQPRSSRLPSGLTDQSVSPSAACKPPQAVPEETYCSKSRLAAKPSHEPETVAKAVRAAASPSKVPRRLAMRLRCRHCPHRADSNRAMRQHYIEQHAAAASARSQRRRGSLLWQQQQSAGANDVCSRTTTASNPSRAASVTSASARNRSAVGSSKPSDDDWIPTVGQKCDRCDKVVVGEVADFEEHRLLHLCATRECELNEAERIGPLHADFLRLCCAGQQLRRRGRRRTAADLTCPECTVRCESGESMVIHMRLHSGHRPYVCVVCYQRFSEGQQLASHLREHCSKSPRRSQPTAHTRRVSPSCEWTQGVTSMSVQVSGEQTLPAIVTNTSSERLNDRQLCTVVGCGKTFRDLRGLAVHLRRHRGEKPYACDICDYQCASPSERSRHRKVHGGIGDRGRTASCAATSRSHSCDYCPYVAASAYHLRRHVRVHTGCKPYSCPYCDYRCNTEHNLRKHVLNSGRHRGLAVYKCPLVPVVATDHFGSSIQPSLASMSSDTTRLPPLQLNVCSFTCNLAVELVEHVRREHGDQANAVQRAASSAARFCGLLNSAEDIGSVPEGSLVLPPRRCTTDLAGSHRRTAVRDQP